MAKYILDMPEWWKPSAGKIEYEALCKALANAKEAAEVTTWQGEPKHNGKPVRLFAVQKEREEGV